MAAYIKFKNALVKFLREIVVENDYYNEHIYDWTRGYIRGREDVIKEIESFKYEDGINKR